MDRYWLLTNTCYGNWLPGDRRGFVGHVSDHRPEDAVEPPRVTHNIPGTAYDEDVPALLQASHELMKAPPIHLTLAQAEVFLAQVQESATFRGWELSAVAIMFNHFH